MPLFPACAWNLHASLVHASTLPSHHMCATPTVAQHLNPYPHPLGFHYHFVASQVAALPGPPPSFIDPRRWGTPPQSDHSGFTFRRLHLDEASAMNPLLLRLHLDGAPLCRTTREPSSRDMSPRSLCTSITTAFQRRSGNCATWSTLSRPREPPSSSAIDLVSVYVVLTIEIGMDYTSKHCWNWCIGYVETWWWDYCNCIVYVYFVWFHHMVVMVNVV
jgi:hypothetical protein